MRPTRRGIGTVIAGALLLAAGFAFDYPELAVLGVTALVAMAWAVAYTVARPRLAVRRTVEPDRVTRGEACTQTLTVGNAGPLRTGWLLARDECGERTVPVPLLRLRRGRDTVVSYPVPTHRRGVVRVGPLTVQRRDPLGLMGGASSHGGTATVWVHPRSHPLTAVPTGIARSPDGRIDRVPHGSITFDALREYVIGDELRHVHWRTTARMGELMVREHLDTSLPRIVVLLDDRAAGYLGSDPECFEHACEAAASVLVAAVREELPVELLRVTGHLGDPTARHGDPTTRHGDPVADTADAFATVRAAGAVRRGPAAIAGLLDRLAEVRLAPIQTRDGLGATVRRLRQYRLGDTLVYLTGTGRPGDLATVATLRSGYPTIVAGVFGDPARAPSTVEGVHVLAVADAAAFAFAWDGIGRW